LIALRKKSPQVASYYQPPNLERAEGQNPTGNSGFQIHRDDPVLSDPSLSQPIPEEVDKKEAEALFKEALGTSGVDDRIALFLQAIDKDPQFVEAYYNLGYSYASKRRTDKAIEYYAQVLQMDPKFTKASYSLGAIHFNQGDYEEALKNFKNVAFYQSDYPMIHHTIAKVYILMKKFPDAMQELEQQLSISTNPKEIQICETLVQKLKPYIDQK